MSNYHVCPPAHPLGNVISSPSQILEAIFSIRAPPPPPSFHDPTDAVAASLPSPRPLHQRSTSPDLPSTTTTRPPSPLPFPAAEQQPGYAQQPQQQQPLVTSAQSSAPSSPYGHWAFRKSIDKVASSQAKGTLNPMASSQVKGSPNLVVATSMEAEIQESSRPRELLRIGWVGNRSHKMM